MPYRSREAYVAYHRAYRARRREYFKEYGKKRRALPRIKAASKAYYQRTRPKRLARNKVLYRENRAEQLRLSRAWKLVHPEQAREQQRLYRERNREVIRKRASAWARAHRADAARRKRERCKRSAAFTMLCRLRARLSHLIRKGRAAKVESAVRLVGCDFPQLMVHLESQFTKGMTWENRRLWEIDHIRPCKSFDLTKIEQQRQCFHYTNLQPLWRTDNRRKSAKLQAGMLGGQPQGESNAGF